MTSLAMTIHAFRSELRASMGNRSKLSNLHSEVTVQINHSYGEEKETLLKFRQEVKDALNCRVPDTWGAN